MKRLSINEVTTYRWNFEEDVTRYAQAGVPAIGLWRQKLSDFGEEKALELLRDSGLAISHLQWAGGFTGHDGRTHKESIDDAIEAIRLAGLLRAPVLVVHTGPRGGHTHNHAKRLVRKALEQLMVHAEEHNVRLAVEPMHSACAVDWTMLTSLAEATTLIDELQSPLLGMVYDTFHLGHDPTNISGIEQAVERIFLVQLGDTRAIPTREANRCPLGEGIVPLGELACALAGAGYRGDYDVELLGEDLDDMEYDQLIEHAKGAFERLVPAVAE
jgi:sugar phosphate isomerase/epimerase